MVPKQEAPKRDQCQGNGDGPYTQMRWLMTSSPAAAFQLKIGIAKREATNVPGRKNIVTAAMAFIEVLSRLLSSAICLVASPSCRLAFVSSLLSSCSRWAMMLNKPCI